MSEEATSAVRAESSGEEGIAAFGFVFLLIRHAFVVHFCPSVGELTFLPVTTFSEIHPILAHLGLELAGVNGGLALGAAEVEGEIFDAVKIIQRIGHQCIV